MPRTVSRLLLLLGLVAAPLGAHGQILTRMLGWQPDLPAQTSDWRPGLVGDEGQVSITEGQVRAGAVLASIPVRHAATGVITANSKIPANVTRRLGKLIGQPVFAIKLDGLEEPVWCRWDPKPRKSFLAALDPVPTGACYPVLHETASTVDVFGPQGVFVTRLSWRREITGMVPGLRVERTQQQIGPPMRLEYVLERIAREQVSVRPVVRWAGGEAPLSLTHARFDSDGAASVAALDGSLRLERLAGDASALAATVASPLRRSYDGVHVL